jgi:acyl-CoA synthetase (AMP-forming)/AMP-acid ligase II
MSSALLTASSPVEVLRHWAVERPDKRAYVFLSEFGGAETSLSFADLDRRVAAAAGQIAARAAPGERAVLLFPPGLDFVVAYFACLRAGVIAVPMMVPRRASSRDSSAAILADCAPRLALTNPALSTSRPDVVERLGGVTFEWLIVDAAAEIAEHATRTTTMTPGRADVAFLQYTSGSTSSPKGVVVTHGNLVENLEMIRLALSNTEQSTYVSWVPLYHDMGLILNVLQTLYVGATCVLMAPGAFIRQPLSWLRAIHSYRAEVAGAPNFAFDLCVSRFRESQMQDVDLSCWKLAFNGAEPVRADTIERFAATFARYGFDAKAAYPCYGLAEATLLVSGGRRGHGPVTRAVSREHLQRQHIAEPAGPSDRQVLVGCGRSLVGERIAIVDPESRHDLGASRVGEIWVAGANVTHGYWQNAAATRAAFDVTIEDGSDEHWLRTGDLGFLDEDGELFVTGRIKDLIIIRGINHYPQDIENTVQNSHPALRRNCGAAFAAWEDDQREMLVVVQEVERTQRHTLDIENVVGAIREAVANEHEITVDHIVLARPGTVPKTTSGKIQRSLTRTLWQEGQLDSLEAAQPVDMSTR